MALIRCPICDTVFESTGSTLMPFCSLRCQRIDLNRWLDEGYSLPIESEQEPRDKDRADDPES